MQDMATAFANPDHYPVDARGLLYFVFTSIKHPGAGQFYLFGTRKDGQPLDGSGLIISRYRCAAHQWRRHHVHTRRAARQPPRRLASKSPDGSADFGHFGFGTYDNASNWIPTKAGQKFELIFRLYDRTKR